jgi:hypothetical protein
LKFSKTVQELKLHHLLHLRKTQVLLKSLERAPNLETSLGKSSASSSASGSFFLIMSETFVLESTNALLHHHHLH